MTRRVRRFLIATCALALCGVPAFAQTGERAPGGPAAQPSEQAPAAASNLGPFDSVANEIALLRKSVQTLSTRLREINEKVFAPESKQPGASKEPPDPIARGLDLLSRSEQRAEALRKQLLEVTEKETGYRNRLLQLDEEMRPDSIERATSITGSTRAPEVREVRRRILENERKGVESLLNLTVQGRFRLEEDVRQAEALVLKIRQRVLPSIEKEIEKINP